MAFKPLDAAQDRYRRAMQRPAFSRACRAARFIDRQLQKKQADQSMNEQDSEDNGKLA
jgi:hypothetical protein